MLFGIHSENLDSSLLFSAIMFSASTKAILPLKFAAAVKVFPYLKSEEHKIFYASNILSHNSVTVNYSLSLLPLLTNGARPVMKKCNLGNGIKLVDIALKDSLISPGNLMLLVTPHIAKETIWLRSPYVGVSIPSYILFICNKASLSIVIHMSAFSIF